MNRNFTELFRQHWYQKLNQRPLSEGDEEESIASHLKLYVPAMLGAGERVNSEQRINATDEIQRFLASDKRLLLLLGDSGAGKTLLGQWLVNEMWEHPMGWVPLFLHLPAIDIKEDFLNVYLRVQHDLLNDDVSEIKKHTPILLILDAYDEMKTEYKRTNLYKLGKLYQWNIKVILSCRTEALVSVNSLDQLALFQPYQDDKTPLKFSWERRYVQVFDPKTQIQSYIQRWKIHHPDLAKEDIDYLQVINTIPSLADMITNPFVLWIVMFALPELLEKHANKPKFEQYYVTRLNLFDAFTRAWFERQKNKLIRNQQLARDDEWTKTIVEDYRCYCEQLANLMWQKKMNSVRYEPLPASTTHRMHWVSLVSSESNEKTIWDTFFAPKGFFNNDPNKSLAIIRQGALLRIDEGQNYAFLHNALLEYFAAKRLFASAITKASIAFGLEINTHLLTDKPEIIRLGVDFLKDNPSFELVLRDILEESKHEVRVETAAANAITLLVAANKSFAGENLSHIRIRYANVAGGNFEGTDLREADLRDVNISQAWLANAKLSGSCVDRLQTGELWGKHWIAQ